MSTLLQKLERISEGNVQPLGFGAAATRTKIMPMLVIASFPAENAELVAISAKNGADALLINVESPEKESNALVKIKTSKIGIPWGVSLETVTKKQIEHLVDMGCDFIIFTPEKTPAAILTDERIGKVLRISPSMPDSLARAINRLQLDAVLISPASEEVSPFTVQQLMAYERLASASGKHLLATMTRALTAEDIEILWRLGIGGLVVDLTLEQPAQRLSKIREAIQKLPATRKKSKETFRATLPLPHTPSEKPEEDDEEGD